MRVRVCVYVCCGVLAHVHDGPRQILQYPNSLSRSFRAAMTEVFKEITQASLGRIRKTPEIPPRVSVYDVIGVITGQLPKHCVTTFDRLSNSHPEVTTTCGKFKFAGQGQRETPVADAREITEIIMVLSGRGAAQFRKKSADVIVRYLGGCPTLVEEIAANRVAQENLPEEHPMRLFGETVESEAIKRKREEVQLADLDLQLIEIKSRAKKARVASVTESVEIGLQCMRNLGLPVDDRARARANDLIQQAVFEEAHDAPDDPEICIRQFLQQKGVRDTSMDARIGKLAKQLLLNESPQYVFPKKSIYCNGQMLEANIWRTSQKDYLEQALTTIMATATRAASHHQ